jgi:hypothetical protein
VPYVDHGVEVMYRWADIDPFDVRTTYFGCVTWNSHEYAVVQRLPY